MNFTVGVSGASWANGEIRKMSTQLGRALAERGYVILCGGLNTGVMRAVCEGAASVPDRMPIVGILPGTDRSEGNSFLDVSIPTGLGYIRNTILAIASDVIVGVSGGAGTLSEIAYAWQYSVPIVLLARSGGWAEKLSDEGLDHRRGKILIAVEEVDQVIAAIETIRASRSGSKGRRKLEAGGGNDVRKTSADHGAHGMGGGEPHEVCRQARALDGGRHVRIRPRRAFERGA